MIASVTEAGPTGLKSSKKREKTLKTDPLYILAKKKCGMTDAEVGMAIRLHIGPETLIRNASAVKTERWKDPVPLHTRRIYEERFEKKELQYRNQKMKQIIKKAEIDPVIRMARKMGFTRSECFMVKALRLSEEDLLMLSRKAKRNRNISAALLVRRMYDELTAAEAQIREGSHGRRENSRETETRE